ncbi:hypothetical protein HY478_01325, partial [Candidatus Uhrbacteria bacterium]|nr:hypothetical protein [Candidatus Uhrbacteria bacterium]
MVAMILVLSVFPLETYAAANLDDYVCPGGEKPSEGSYGVVCTFGNTIYYSPAIHVPETNCPSGTKVGAKWSAPTRTNDYGNVVPICVDSAGKEISGAVATAGLSCGYFWNWVGFTCFLRLFSVLTGTVLISLTAFFLALSAFLFNVLVHHTVVSFGYLFNDGVQQAINVGWGGIRDIANIVIIGLFVFLAINIILGVKDFGDKSKIARFLIIAVLINFSLLFTKVIIDASNFTAFQFYKASGLGIAPDTPAVGDFWSGEFAKKGLAGEFIKVMRLPSA